MKPVTHVFSMYIEYINGPAIRKFQFRQGANIPVEATLMLTGLTVGGFLVFPLILDFIRQNAQILVGTACLMFGLYVAAPYSPEARILWYPISQIPDTVVQAVQEGGDGMARLGSEYFAAFHP